VIALQCTESEFGIVLEGEVNYLGTEARKVVSEMWGWLRKELCSMWEGLRRELKCEWEGLKYEVNIIKPSIYVIK
jgi:hypothetical protein